MSALPQIYGDVAVQNGDSPIWNVTIDDGVTYSRDDQAMDQIIAGPSQLKYHLGQTGSDLDTAEAIAAGWRSQKKTQ